MPPPQFDPRALLASPAMQQVAIPTQQQRDEVEKLQGLQIRTNAIQLAVALRSGKEGTVREAIADAAAIADYIIG